MTAFPTPQTNKRNPILGASIVTPAEAASDNGRSCRERLIPISAERWDYTQPRRFRLSARELGYGIRTAVRRGGHLSRPADDDLHWWIRTAAAMMGSLAGSTVICQAGRTE